MVAVRAIAAVREIGLSGAERDIHPRSIMFASESYGCGGPSARAAGAGRPRATVLAHEPPHTEKEQRDHEENDACRCRPSLAIGRLRVIALLDADGAPRAGSLYPELLRYRRCPVHGLELFEGSELQLTGLRHRGI